MLRLSSDSPFAPSQCTGHFHTFQGTVMGRLLFVWNTFSEKTL
jgi:hypothetical protein